MVDERNGMQGAQKPAINPEFPLDPVDNVPPPPPPPPFDAETGEIIERKPVGTKTPQPSPPPQNKPAVVAQSPFVDLLRSKEAALKNFLGNKENAMKFMSSVMHSMEKVPELAKCSKQSLIGAFMECAAVGLYPGNASGDCYVLPYKGKAQFQLGYKGVKTLAYRSGVLKLWAEVIYKNDRYREILGTNPRIEHDPPPFGTDRGEPIGAYACAEVTHENVIFKSLTKDQIMAIKKRSPGASSEYSPWNSGIDGDYWMWKKCAIKQLGKTMPQSDQLKRAIYLDNVSERGGYIEKEGEVIEVPFSSPEEKNEDNIEAGKDKKAQMRAKKK